MKMTAKHNTLKILEIKAKDVIDGYLMGDELEAVEQRIMGLLREVTE